MFIFERENREGAERERERERDRRTEDPKKAPH